MPKSSSHPKGMSEAATKVEDEHDGYPGTEHEIDPMLHLDDVTDPRRTIPSNRWVRSYAYRDDDEEFQPDNVELGDESDTDEMVIVARANVRCIQSLRAGHVIIVWFFMFPAHEGCSGNDYTDTEETNTGGF